MVKIPHGLTLFRFFKDNLKMRVWRKKKYFESLLFIYKSSSPSCTSSSNNNSNNNKNENNDNDNHDNKKMK